MPKYHPETRFIADYAAGSLPSSQALCVAAHLHYCETCRRRIQHITDLGSILFEDLPPLQPSLDFSSLMARIDTSHENEADLAVSASASQNRKTDTELPASLEKLTKGNLEGLPWHAIGKYFRYSELEVGDPERETSLFNIKAGGNVPRHSHRGDEITVVLQGSFSDQDDNYHTGDFIVRTAGETHKPVAAQHEDCLCLSTLNSPIQMTNWFYRLLFPLFKKSAQHA